MLQITRAGILASFWVLTATGVAQPTKTVEKAFKAGNNFLEKQQYAQALTQYRVVLKAAPNDASTLWNAGGAAFFVRDFRAAAIYFGRLQKQEPNNGHLLAKRLQTAQATMDLKTRDVLRARIFALHKSGKDSTGYASKPSFCRDQFSLGKDQILAFETFVLKPRGDKKDALFLGKRLEFFVVAPDGNEKMRVETGWSALDLKRDGTFVPSAEMPAYYYDAYYSSGPVARRTFGLLPDEPTYEQAKRQVIAIIGGKLEPVTVKKR